MPVKTEKELTPDQRALWLKATHAIEIRNFGYAFSLIQAILKDEPEFLDGRRLLRKAAAINSKSKRSMFSGLNTITLKGASTLKKDPKAALEMAEKELESDPYNVQANHLLRDAALALGMEETATFALETIVEGHPKESKYLHDLGQRYLDIDEPAKAVATFRKAVELNPADLVAAKREKDAAARQTMKHGGWEEVHQSKGEKDYRDLIKDKEEAVSLEQKSRVVKSEEMLDQQIAELGAQYEANPKSLDVARKLAGLFEQKGDLSSAQQWYEYASGLTNNTDPMLLRKASDLRLKALDQSIQEREQFLAAAPDHEEAPRLTQELADLKQQKAEMLIAEARKRVERNPTDLQARFEYGEQLLLAGHPTEAIPELQKARTHANARIRAMNLLAQCYVAKGMLDFAVRTFTEATKELSVMDETKKDILYRLGEIHERQNNKEAALECFKQIYEVDYGYKDVAQRVESSYG